MKVLVTRPEADAAPIAAEITAMADIRSVQKRAAAAGITNSATAKVTSVSPVPTRTKSRKR